MHADRKQWHFGVLSFTGTGHLNAMIALAQELKQRGHRVTFFEKSKIENRVRQAGLEFFAVGDKISPFRGKRPTAHNASFLSELSLLRFNLARISHDLRSISMTLRRHLVGRVWMFY
jgi:UDP:flavonoid glycosyltransferase YjiC (YdhE family)